MDAMLAQPFVEAREAHVSCHKRCAREPERHQELPLGIHVVERRPDEDVLHLPVRAAHQRGQAADKHPVVVRQQAALGEARGTRGVLQVHQVRRHHLGRRGERHLTVCDEPLPVEARRRRRSAVNDRALVGQQWWPRRDSPQHGKQLGIYDKELRIRILEHEAQLGACVGGVNGHHHRPQATKSDPGDRERRHVRQHHRHVCALAHTARQQAAGQPVGGRVEFTVGKAHAFLEPMAGERVAQHLGAVVHELSERRRHVSDVFQNLAQALHLGHSGVGSLRRRHRGGAVGYLHRASGCDGAASPAFVTSSIRNSRAALPPNHAARTSSSRGNASSSVKYRRAD